MFEIIKAIPLYRSNLRDEWDICIDGVWYRADFEGTDNSDRAMLRKDILEKELEIKDIFWGNCSENVEEMGYKKIVFMNNDEGYLIKINE